MNNNIKPYQIVIDTNVIIAGLRSSRGASYKLLSMLKDSRWQINISTTLLMEYEEILHRERSNLKLSEHDIDDFLDGICHIADIPHNLTQNPNITADNPPPTNPTKTHEPH